MHETHEPRVGFDVVDFAEHAQAGPGDRAAPLDVEVCGLSKVLAARSAKVLFVNGHRSTRRLVGSLRDIGERSGLAANDLDRFEVASWVPLPNPDNTDDRWVGCGYDVVFIDCLDEMFRPQAWPEADEWIRQGQVAAGVCAKIVYGARRHRARRRSRPDRLPQLQGSPRCHRVSLAFDDLADRWCQIFFNEEAEIRVRLASRGDSR